MSARRVDAVRDEASRRPGSRLLPGWLLLVVCAAAAWLGVVGPDALAQPEPEPTAPVEPEPEPPPEPAAPAEARPSPAPAAHPAGAASPRPHGGLNALPGDAEVPLEWMPPGSEHSPVPSQQIFPPQSITIRFNHKLHVSEQNLTCKVCHAAAYASDAAADRLLPEPSATCDGCHDVDHADLSNVRAGADANGQCTYCHLGEGAGVSGKVAPLVIPEPNLRFSHQKHLVRNIGCAQCHGKVEQLELATRDQLPRMAGCFKCHNMPSPARGEAHGACTTCHLSQPDGRLVTSFPTGELLPPRWLRSSAHTVDWIERHKLVAANDSQLCASCHSVNECTACHDGRVRDRRVHPNDWISMHAQAGRQDNPRCVSCHQLQTFCADCHRRVGVARDVASGSRTTGRRFHPPPSEWTTAPRGPTHHAWEAMRNLNACVSCHTERDCATCHATKGFSGGQGVNPHPIGFRSACASALRKNPRPCLVCHQAGDANLRACR